MALQELFLLNSLCSPFFGYAYPLGSIKTFELIGALLSPHRHPT